jgi:8-amino-7-oxononanoate synthase
MMGDAPMLDFTSSLYLGLRHPNTSLRPWAQFTTGVPAVLGQPPLARTVAAGLAALVDAERATLSRSTLHAFWDLFLILGEQDMAIYMDASVYPIPRWGIERAACRGVPVRTFRHYDCANLSQRLLEDSGRRLRPLVVADGFCTGCGRLAPIGQYLAQAREFGGIVVLDDTQAIGVFGRSPAAAVSYGSGGGGSLRAKNLSSASFILVSSLAKGFGVPVAMIAGSADQISLFEASSQTMINSSPPSLADLHAAEHALQVNRECGDTFRSRLLTLVRRFRRGLVASGIRVGNSLFPIQSLTLNPAAARRLHRSLARLGIHAVLHRPGCRREATLSFLITASHSNSAVDRAVAATAYALSHSGLARSNTGSSGAHAVANGLLPEDREKQELKYFGY